MRNRAYSGSYTGILMLTCEWKTVLKYPTLKYYTSLLLNLQHKIYRPTSGSKPGGLMKLLEGGGLKMYEYICMSIVMSTYVNKAKTCQFLAI